MSTETATHELREMTAYTLANLADCQVSTRDSAGAAWLADIRDAVLEAYDWHRTSDDMSHAETVDHIRDDRRHELADSAVPIYNDDRMAILTETRAYFEDCSDYTSGGEDVLTIAGYALYIVAERLVHELLAAMPEDDA